MAFISSAFFAPRPVLSRSALCGAAVSTTVSAAPAAVRMQEMSPSVPFLPKPANLSPDMPGYAGFDPLGFSDFIDIKFLQEAEIKHARVCMLAVIGVFVSEFFTFPFYSAPSPLASKVHEWGVTQGSMQQLLLWISIFEVVVGTPALIQMISLDSPRKPGEFAFDPLGLGKTEAALKKNGTAELVNGRLAMIAIGGLIHQQWLTNEMTVQQLLNFGK